MKISACMIIKNESELLSQCLNSIKWVDEIICVDTGSTDDSIVIAERYGAKIYKHPWRNNFSLHRNQSIQYSTGDWFLTIDADEVLIPETDLKYIRTYLAGLPSNISALLAETTEISSGEKRASWLSHKFFRKNDFIEFQQIVHNEPRFKNNSAITDIRFNHFGYSLCVDKMRLKNTRTKNLLIQRIDNAPEDYVAHLYLSQNFLYEDNFKEAEKHGMAYFCFSEKNNDIRYHGIACFFMCLIWISIDNYKKAYSWCKKGLKDCANNIDLNYMMAIICCQLKRKRKAHKHANKYFLEFVRLRNSSPQNITNFTTNDTARAEIRRHLGHVL